MFRNYKLSNFSGFSMSGTQNVTIRNFAITINFGFLSNHIKMTENDIILVRNFSVKTDIFFHLFGQLIHL